MNFFCTKKRLFRKVLNDELTFSESFTINYRYVLRIISHELYLKEVENNNPTERIWPVPFKKIIEIE